jgi:anti-sigma28 factor (negative regulator of flagellin synthesis)
VDEIKREIENGTYKVDIKKTAKAMAKSLLF